MIKTKLGFYRELKKAFNNLPHKVLIDGEFIEGTGRLEPWKEYAYCSIGALGRLKGCEVDVWNGEGPSTPAEVLGVPVEWVEDVIEMNDINPDESSEERFARMQGWLAGRIHSLIGAKRRATRNTATPPTKHKAKNTK